MEGKLTRREFLGRMVRSLAGAGVGLTLPTFVSARALGTKGQVPANDRITLGFIGVGGMGSGHLRGFLGNSQVQVLAVCDVYEPHRARAKSWVDERYGNSDCAAYKDYRELLDRNDLDAVVISTPDHWHTLISIHACEAGKDVYCEKPLTLTIAEGRALVNAVRRYGRVFQVGSQQRSASNFRFACELVRSGRIGKVHTVRTGFGYGPQGGNAPDQEPPPGLDWNLWLGPAPWGPYNPDRCLYNFRWFWDYSGGKMTDWGAHHNDIAQWGLGMDESGPVEIEGEGRFPTEGNYETAIWFRIEYTYANGVKLICGEGHGAKFEGTDGWVHVDRGFLRAYPEDLLHEPLGPNDVHLYRSPGHHQDWLNCIRSRQRPICDVEIGHRSVTVCHLGNIAIRTGRKLRWDPVKEQFIGDPEANRWLSKPYRAPWHL
ncbi:MAG TPA: Gfo/Idh/MocA family oxidoreductase [Armatimonadetes bacterium]|nr:Gfo/Idh/MocA family oxidoreductase [Armatimonadota bacterium]